MTENINKWNGENPWMGLGAYSEGQRLYGRDKETAALTDIILNHTAIVVYGKSGIGKSSLLKAGVFPLLRQQHFVPIYLRLAHNTDISYIQQIENAISENVTLQALLPDNIPNLGFWDFLHRNRFTDIEGNVVTPVIVLDQFEEIFTLTQVDHKADIQAFFSELADVLNDVKPDKVIQAELLYVQAAKEPLRESEGFNLQPLSKSVLKYDKSPSFRLVISLRDDSLYLLERNSAKIPALKANGYNLNALDEKNAMEVIMKPCPGLFTEKQGEEILNGLAYYEYDDYRVVDPAILSLFLFSFFNGQGKVAYNDIFERYYQECTKDISESSVSYIEDHLLTDRGNRNQIPLNDLIGLGISASEMVLLLERKILKTEKRKGVNYVEFSHDRLCDQALRHREERKLREQSLRMRKKMLVFGIIGILIIGIMAIFFWQNKEKQIAQSERQDAQIKLKIQNIEKDSIQRLNHNLNLQIRVNELQKDSLNQQIHINEKQKDSIQRLNNSLNKQIQISNMKNVELERLLSINVSIRNNLQKQLTINEQKSDSLSNLLKVFQAQAAYIEEMDDINTAKKTEKNDALYVISPVLSVCNNIRSAVSTGNISMLIEANSRLKELNPMYFNGIRQIDKEVIPLYGHFIYNHEFIDELIASGNPSYSNIQFQESTSNDRSIIKNENTGAFLINYCIKESETTTYEFISRGHQELAIVTEPGGFVTVRIHDKTNDIWYNQAKNEMQGSSSSSFSFELPTNKVNHIEIEITNRTKSVISFVIISN